MQDFSLLKLPKWITLLLLLSTGLHAGPSSAKGKNLKKTRRTTTSGSDFTLWLGANAGIPFLTSDDHLKDRLYTGSLFGFAWEAR